MNRTIIIVILSVLSSSSHAADQWLCTGEEATVLYWELDGEFKSEAGSYDEKIVVSDNGFKFVGQDESYFNAEDCDWDSALRCGSDRHPHGFFAMSVAQFGGKVVARYHRFEIVFSDVFTMNHIQVIGSCSKL